MAASKEYTYQIKANKISLFEKDVTTGDSGLNYTYTEGAGLNIPSGPVLYKSPLTDVTNGLEIEFVFVPDFLNGGDESSVIDLPSYLTKALVYYVQAKMREDTKDIEGKEYFMREYKKILERHESGKIGGVRIIGSGSHAIR